MAASVARMEGSVIEQLLAMRRAIAPFNAARGLRTVLLYTGGWILQWHEGPADAIERTWRISLSHTTHRHARILHRSCGPAALREPVQIAALFGPDKLADVARKLFDVEREQAETPIEPLDIWRRFAAPPAGRLALARAPARSVIAVVSEDSESVDVVKALAERCGVPVNYQRFAGPDLHTGDAGAAYVDVPIGAARARVQALARHALGYGVVRLSFTRCDSVALLLHAPSHRAQALSEAVSSFASAFEPAPAIHVLDAVRGGQVQGVLELAAPTV
jgi:hypothetical protein